MGSQHQNEKRIAKNTLYLYIRMGVTMLVQLYTSRIVLDNLGIENYGIYSVVAAFIVAFTFISGPLGTATQRFLNFELGRKEGGKVNEVFNHCFFTYIVLGIALVCIIELAGNWYISNKMSLPAGRHDAALWTFHFSVIALFINLIKTPFEALIISHEKMFFYAYLSIVEVLLKLLNAFSLQFFLIDKLKLYAINHFFIALIIMFATFAFSIISFKDIHICWIKKIWDYDLFKKLLSFSGWSLFGAVASMSANQGLNILLNLFYGVTVNAAMGITTQINNAMNNFVKNFQVAFRPQLVKYYAAGNLPSMRALIINSSKYSFLLLFAVVCPLCFNIHFVLDLWLKVVPDYVAEFCICILTYTLLETLSAPLWMSVQATGNIKYYQLSISTAMLMNITLSYIFLKQGFGPIIVLVIKCFLDIIYLIIRLAFVKAKIQLSVKKFLSGSIVPSAIIATSSILLFHFLSQIPFSGFAKLTTTTILFEIFYFIFVFFIGLNKQDRFLLISTIKKKFGEKK